MPKHPASIYLAAKLIQIYQFKYNHINVTFKNTITMKQLSTQLI